MDELILLQQMVTNAARSHSQRQAFSRETKFLKQIHYLFVSYNFGLYNKRSSNLKYLVLNI